MNKNDLITAFRQDESPSSSLGHKELNGNSERQSASITEDRRASALERRQSSGTDTSFIFVIGMHRSGTSLVAKLLSMAGADIGDEADLISGDSNNAKGYFENRAVWGVNEALLDELGAAWYAPPRISDKAGINLTGRMVETHDELVSRFEHSPSVVLKDPRTSILLPAWRSVFPDARFVVCLRNPLDVSASLSRRDGFPLDLSCALWALYTMASLRDTHPAERRIVRYSNVLADPEKTLRPVLDFLGLGWNVNWGGVRRFTDADLSHSSCSDASFFSHPEVADSVKDLYERAIVDSQAGAPVSVSSLAASELEWHGTIEKYKGLIDRQNSVCSSIHTDMNLLRADRDGLRTYYQDLLTKPLAWALGSVIKRRLNYRSGKTV